MPDHDEIGAADDLEEVVHDALMSYEWPLARDLGGYGEGGYRQAFGDLDYRELARHIAAVIREVTRNEG